MSTFPSDADGDFELYALDALSADEHERVRLALRDATPQEREAMLQRIASAQEAAAALTESADLDQTPPASVREELLRAIEKRDPATGASEGSNVFDARSRFRPAILAAAAVVVLVFGGAIATIAVRSGSDSTDIAGPEDTSQTSVPTDDPTSMVDQIMNAPDANVTDAPLGGGAAAKLMASEQLNMAVVEVSGMPAAPEGMHYQLWLNGFGPDLVAGGPMTVADGQTLMAGIDELAQTSGVAVTQEPNSDPNPPAPTGEVLMEMDL